MDHVNVAQICGTVGDFMVFLYLGNPMIASDCLFEQLLYHAHGCHLEIYWACNHLIPKFCFRQMVSISVRIMSEFLRRPNTTDAWFQMLVPAEAIQSRLILTKYLMWIYSHEHKGACVRKPIWSESEDEFLFYFFIFTSIITRHFTNCGRKGEEHPRCWCVFPTPTAQEWISICSAWLFCCLWFGIQ